MNDKETVVEEIGMREEAISFSIDRTEYKCSHYTPDDNAAVVMCSGITYNLSFPEVLAPSVDHGAEKDSVNNGGFVSPMPGKVIRVNVSEGEEVNRGTIMIVIEAMKMENNIVASNAAIVEKLNVAVGDMVDTKTELIVLKELTN
jgi:biotin carboxyl carrier protein